MAVQQFLMMGTSSVQRNIVTGELWAWGQNNHGQLGQNNTTNTGGYAPGDLPIQVGGLTDWQNTINCASGSYSSVSTVKSDGTLWAWGLNNHGQLGLNDTTTRSSPVQVGSDTDWAEVTTLATARNFGIKTDGTLYSWGEGANGALGHSNTTNLSVPTQVGSLTDWKHVCNSQGGTRIVALKTDGTMWQWGSNWTTWHGGHFSSPVQVGSATDWTDVVAMGYTGPYQVNYAIKEA
jgi:alpha-tubulin suppressor-like RCC1 family protein